MTLYLSYKSLSCGSRSWCELDTNSSWPGLSSNKHTTLRAALHMPNTNDHQQCTLLSFPCREWKHTSISPSCYPDVVSLLTSQSTCFLTPSCGGCGLPALFALSTTALEPVSSLYAPFTAAPRTSYARCAWAKRSFSRLSIRLDTYIQMML